MPNTRVTRIKSGANADFKLEHDKIYVYDEVAGNLVEVNSLDDVQAEQYVFLGAKTERRIDTTESNISLLVHKLENLTTDDIPQGTTNTYLLNNGNSSQPFVSDAINLVTDGHKIFKQFANNRLEFKTIKTATGINVNETANDLTFELDATALGNSSSWSVKVNFDSNGEPTTVEDLPAGVTATVNGTDITFVHNFSRTVKSVIYMGYDAVTDEYRMRFPTATYIVSSNPATITSEFRIKVNTAAAGADANGHALVNVIM